MENRGFNWVVTHLLNRAPGFPMLEFCKCRGEFITRRYLLDAEGYLIPQSVKLKVRHCLTNLLETLEFPSLTAPRSPTLCVVYLPDSLRLFTAREVVGLTPARVLSLQIQTMHMVSPGLVSVYSAKCMSQFASFVCKPKLLVAQHTHFKLEEVAQRINWLVAELNKTVMSTYNSSIYKLRLDVLLTEDGHCFLLKTHRLVLSRVCLSRTRLRTHTKAPAVGGSVKRVRHLTHVRTVKQSEPLPFARSEFFKMIWKTIRKNKEQPNSVQNFAELLKSPAKLLNEKKQRRRPSMQLDLARVERFRKEAEQRQLSRQNKPASSRRSI